MLALVLHTITLLAAVSAGSVKYDPLSSLSDFPEFRRGLMKYRAHHHGHLRARRPHKMALAHHYGVVHPSHSGTFEDSVGVASVDEKPVTLPMTLPGRHKSVEKALDGMGGDLVVLKEKQLAAKDARGQLEGKVSDVVHHMNDAMSIKHAIAAKEALLRKQKNKILGLEREAKHVDETHTSLVASLHRVLEPKLLFARERLAKQEMKLEKEQHAETGWQEKRDQLHAHALETLKEKKVAYASLMQAEQQTAEVKKMEDAARIKFEQERKRTSQEVQSFRYSETRLKAEVTHEKAAEEATMEAKESVNKLTNVLQVESEKVVESMAVNRDRIRQKMQQIENSRTKSRNELEGLKNEYRAWQEHQRTRAVEVVRKGQDTAMAAQAYAEDQRKVLDSAQAKVAREAEAKSDWAGEAFNDDSDAGFTDDTPSISLGN